MARDNIPRQLMHRYTKHVMKHKKTVSSNDRVGQYGLQAQLARLSWQSNILRAVDQLVMQLQQQQQNYSAVIIVHAAITNSICMHICSYKLLRCRDKVDA